MHAKRSNGRYGTHKTLTEACATWKVMLQVHFVAGGRADPSIVEAGRADLRLPDLGALGLQDVQIDCGRRGGGGQARVPAERVLWQGGPAHATTACDKQADDRPITGGGRDPRPSKALVYDLPGHEGPLPDRLPGPHLLYALQSGFSSEGVRLPRHEPEEGSCQRCSSGVSHHHTACTISRRPCSPPTMRPRSTNHCASIDLGLPQADRDGTPVTRDRSGPSQ